MNAERALGNALAYIHDAREALDDRIGVPARESEMLSREAYYIRHVRNRVQTEYLPKATRREAREREALK
jgi:hypothetical protein